MRGYLPLNRKDSTTYMHGFAVSVKEGLPFARVSSLKNSGNSYLCSRLALLHSMCYFFFLCWSPSSSLCTFIRLTQIDNFSTRISDYDSQSPALLDFFPSSEASICPTMAFPLLGNSEHIIALVSIDFPSNLQRDALFRIAYDYSRAYWDSRLGHSRDILWEDIFKLSASAVGGKFCKYVQVGIDAYIPHRKYHVFSCLFCCHIS